LIVAPLPVAKGHVHFDWARFSAVTIGYSVASPPLHRAVNHQFRSHLMALRTLRKKGYRRLGLALRSSFDERVDHHWIGRFLADQRRHKEADQIPLY